jgi:arylformamidase
VKGVGKIFHDVTLEFSPDSVVYPGDPRVTIEEFGSISKGDKCNLSFITFGSHTGTHVDAPKHFYDDGLTVDQLPLEHFIGVAKVFEVKAEEAIATADLEEHEIKPNDIVLLKTRNSSLVTKAGFETGFVYFTPEAARYLAEIGIRTLGFDYFSVDKFDGAGAEAHYALLEKNIVIIEGLNLSGIEPGEYEMVALPLKIKGGNGSPVRVVLIE